MLTADPRNQAPELTCKALEVGALALQVKPALDAGPEAWNLAREVKLLSSVKVIRHLRGVKRSAPQKPAEPTGTAAAQKGRTAGGAASQPAGTAIAPAKQRQVRSLLIKLGLIAGAGIAFGTVYALSRQTSSVPPGARTTPVTTAVH